jgi:hypothetical protein
MRTVLGRVTRAGAWAALCLSLAGCDGKARKFAVQTAAVLKQRSEQISRKITAETKAYNDLAAHAAEAHRRLVALSLGNERDTRIVALAADYDEGRKPVSLWRIEVGDYARVDYAANRDLLTGDIESSTRYLQNVQALSLEQDRVDTLAKLLNELAQKPSLAQDVEALATFAEETKTDFDTKLCEELKKQKAAGQAGAEEAIKAKGCK